MLSNISFGSSTRPSSQLRSPALGSPSSPTSAIFASLDDELRDARRVYSQGQEEDLRYALDRVIKRVEELSSLLKTAYKTQTDLETQLNLAKSNLQLVISNNEMLEEVLKRETPVSARDVGWRRWSAREVQNQNLERAAMEGEGERPRSLDYGSLNEGGAGPAAPSSAAVVLVNGSKPPAWTPASPAPTPPTPMTGQESRFFRFRFNSGSKSPIPPHASHLTSPSLPSLVPNTREKEFEELQEQLERERRAHKEAADAKVALEAELESLSQALFEEANNMVATERIKRAETEEELQEIRKEKNALREALRLIEGENGRLRSANAPSSGTLSDRTVQPSSSSPSRKSPSPSLPARSTPSPKPPSVPRNGKTTPPVAPSYTPEMPGHLTDFALEPAPKPFGALHRRTQSVDKSKAVAVGEATVSLNDSPPFASRFATPTSVPFIPDEPSPWANATS